MGGKYIRIRLRARLALVVERQTHLYSPGRRLPIYIRCLAAALVWLTEEFGCSFPRLFPLAAAKMKATLAVSRRKTTADTPVERHRKMQIDSQTYLETPPRSSNYTEANEDRYREMMILPTS